jgi:hypothetical protein
MQMHRKEGNLSLSCKSLCSAQAKEKKDRQHNGQQEKREVIGAII